MNPFPVGKLPPEFMARLLAQAPVTDGRVRLGPGAGLDCAVIDLGATLLVFKSDPITFASQDIGWYLVQVNANDIATTGAAPRWMLVTALLPEGGANEALVEGIAGQVFDACRKAGISLIGGHTEITSGLERPILVGTLVGEVRPDKLVTPRGALPGDSLLLTKGVPIEATSLLAREFPKKLAQALSPEEIEQARQFLYSPGISVLQDARLALENGRVTAMHDPTEGGLASALWELSEACGFGLWVDPPAVPVPELSGRICKLFGLDPLACIASGALLLACKAEDRLKICQALAAAGIPCSPIGRVVNEPVGVWYGPAQGRKLLPRPSRDEVAKLFEGKLG